MMSNLLAGVPQPDAALFPDAARRLQWSNDLTTALAQSRQRVVQGPVKAAMDLEAFQAELASFDFDDAVSMDDLFDWTISRLETGLVHLGHPRYLGLFNPAPTFPAQCAERIAASFNPQLASATTSPAAVAIEAHVIRAVCERTGLGPRAVGHFTSGGTEANFTAIVCALTQAAPDFVRIGARAFSGQPVFYISADSHLAWIKIAHQAGIGRDAARQVKTDGIGRMSIDALQAVIREDLAKGCVPFMIAATAGTTNAGMVDPLEPCAEVARCRRLWYHVDAAWGGGLIASPKLQGLVAGIETADSVTIDAHKWFATTMGCGMFLTRHEAALAAAFNVTASFMPSQSASADPYMASAQWSRHFLGLRLFLSLAAGGWAGHAIHVERSVELARLFAEALRKRGWTLVNWPALAVACLEPPPGSLSVRDIVNRVVSSGRAWVSVATFEGRDVLRACVTHGETTPEDIDAVVDALEDCRRREPGNLQLVLENC
jgi:glutamate/tyrosine decarboxylase-like PLP-dependent enzyme